MAQERTALPGGAALGLSSAGSAASAVQVKELAAASGKELRRAERYHVRAAFELQQGDKSQAAEMRNISCDGAFMAVSQAGFGTNTGLRLEFTLPQGFRVNVFGRVAWVRPLADYHGPAGYGIQFYGVDSVNREFIEYYLEFAKKGEAPTVADGRVFERYRIEPRPKGLSVRMCGSLAAIESSELADLIIERIASINGSPFCLFLDVIDLAACPKESLEHIRRWFEKLKEKGELAGVLLGDSSVGPVQVRRMAREAGIADVLVVFDKRDEARRFWAELERTSSSR